MRHYMPHELLSMSEKDMEIALRIVAEWHASWVPCNPRLDAKFARYMKTTTKRLGNIFPESWYFWDEKDVLRLRIPEEFSHLVGVR